MVCGRRIPRLLIVVTIHETYALSKAEGTMHVISNHSNSTSNLPQGYGVDGLGMDLLSLGSIAFRCRERVSA